MYELDLGFTMIFILPINGGACNVIKLGKSLPGRNESITERACGGGGGGGGVLNFAGRDKRFAYSGKNHKCSGVRKPPGSVSSLPSHVFSCPAAAW